MGDVLPPPGKGGDGGQRGRRLLRWEPYRRLALASLLLASVGSSGNRLAGRSPSGSVALSDGVWNGRDTARL